MTAPQLIAVPESAIDVPGDVLVVGVRQGQDGPWLTDDAPALAELQGSLAAIGFAGAAEEVRRVPAAGIAAGSILLVGLGRDEPTASTLRTSAGAALRAIRGVDRVVLDLPWSGESDAVALLEGAGIGGYAFTEYRSAPEPKSSAPGTVVLAAADAAVGAEAVRRATIVVEAVSLVRDLVNTPPSDLYPESFAARAIAEVVGLAGDGAPIGVEVLDETELEELGYGGILGVGRGSQRPPRLVVVRYAPEGAIKHLSLVGKGITFDTGGLSLKPAASMVGMKYDMTGAATVLAATIAAARLGAPIRITARLCLAENMPSGSATRPNDVLVMRGGTTVEVLNTDAEGRLVLADGLVDASAERPDAIVDVATLTGAQRVALGTRIVGAMGDAELTQRVVAIADEVGESFWRMPIGEEFRPMLASDVADIANAKIGNTAGGMLLAAAFLKDFVGRVDDGERSPQLPWTHLDIAGPAHNEGGGWGYTGKGPTGVAVRTLVALAESLAADAG